MLLVSCYDNKMKTGLLARIDGLFEAQFHRQALRDHRTHPPDSWLSRCGGSTPQVQSAHELIKGSELHIMQECKQWAPGEKPEEFSRVVLNFLDR
jgi:pimeloyl-ACP methyl ester carboxylesterase